MSNALINILVNTNPRETSGPRTSNRFEYQKSWSLCKLLNLHLKEQDYLLVLDYHDDVLVLNSEYQPDSICFYQIKTGRRNWTVNSLTKSKDNNKFNSILGKLFSNYRMCKEFTRSLVFVSDKELSATLANGQKAEGAELVNFSQLSVQDKEKIHKSVEEDKQQFCDIAGLSMITIAKTELGVNNNLTHVKGKLVEFFETLYPTKNVSVSLIYKTLSDEIKRRTNSEITCKSEEDLCSNKGIGRNEFSRMVNLFVNRNNIYESWREASQLLSSEGFKFSEIRDIKASWNKYAFERMDISNEPLLTFRRWISNEIKTFETLSTQYDIKAILDFIIQRIDSNAAQNFGKDLCFIKAAIIYEVIESDPVQKTNKEPKEKTT